MLDFWPRFVIGVLATWRLAYLLAEEDGPFDLILRVRRRLGRSVLGRLLDCFYCLSLWMAAPLAVWVTDGWSHRVAVWLALSGGACLLHRLTERQTPGVNILPLSGGEEHALLRSRTSGTED
jgi:hypothetical protein